MGDDADTTQVQAVRIPAGHDRYISHPQTKSMALDGKFKQVQFVFGEFQEIPLQDSFDQLCRADAVEKVNAIIITADIMQEGKVPHHIHVRTGGPG